MRLKPLLKEVVKYFKKHKVKIEEKLAEGPEGTADSDEITILKMSSYAFWPVASTGMCAWLEHAMNVALIIPRAILFIPLVLTFFGSLGVNALFTLKKKQGFGDAFVAPLKEAFSGGSKKTAYVSFGVSLLATAGSMFGVYKLLGWFFDKPAEVHTTLKDKCLDYRTTEGKVSIGGTVAAALLAGGYYLYRWWKPKKADSEGWGTWLGLGKRGSRTGATSKSNSRSNSKSKSGSGSYFWIWIIVAVVVLAVIALAVYFMYAQDDSDLEEEQEPDIENDLMREDEL